MNIYNLKYKMPDEQVNQLAGTLLETNTYDVLVQDNCDVYKPDGSLLLKYRADVIPMELCGTAWKALRKAPKETSNRGNASGKLEGSSIVKGRTIKKDGTLSRTSRAKEVSSGIIGYMDRYPRIPYCRMTAFNIDHYQEFQAALPFVYSVNAVFKKEIPERYQAQLEMINKTNDSFYINNTVFTTITVNKTFRTAVHKDKGDYQNGFGCMSVLEAGQYTGGYLVFPAYRVAVDMRTRGVCLADVHEWHGNTALTGENYERISCIFYYRTNMIECGTPEEELSWAKRRAKGTPMKGLR